jgi:Fe2+ or Zn2+ uptake regulation protein
MSHPLEPESIRAQGFRLTPQRLAILRVLDETAGHLSPSEVFQLASQRLPGVTEATVYRTLDFLVEQGLALIAHIGSGRIIYESAQHDHHHLICHKCGSALAISHSDLQPFYTHLEQITGYRLDSSHVTFFGLCPACREDRPSPSTL